MTAALFPKIAAKGSDLDAIEGRKLEPAIGEIRQIRRDWLPHGRGERGLNVGQADEMKRRHQMDVTRSGGA